MPVPHLIAGDASEKDVRPVPASFTAVTNRAAVLGRLGLGPTVEPISFEGTATLGGFAVRLPPADVARLSVPADAASSPTGLLVNLTVCGRTHPCRVLPTDGGPEIGAFALGALDLQIDPAAGCVVPRDPEAWTTEVPHLDVEDVPPAGGAATVGV